VHIEVIVYEWPYSQVCIDCTHGTFIMSDNLGPSAYICDIGSLKNKGTECPDMVEKETTEGGD
jgi:hypothetical protein